MAQVYLGSYNNNNNQYRLIFKLFPSAVPYHWQSVLEHTFQQNSFECGMQILLSKRESDQITHASDIIIVELLNHCVLGLND